MGRHPLVSGAALAAVLLFACSRTPPAESMSAIRSVTPHAPATGMDLAGPRGLAPGSQTPAAASAATPVGALIPPSATMTSASRRTAAGCPPITPAIIEAGRRIFTGPGNCYGCHGADASGTAMAPTLHAHKWLNIDGSYVSIVGLVQRGVSKPKAHSEVMPPMGGANLSTSQICEVAADVYSLSQPAAASQSAAHAAAAPAVGSLAHAAPTTVGRPGLPQIAPAPASPPAEARGAAASGATSASDPRSMSMRSGNMQITFSGTPENYTVRVESPAGRTSSTYTYSAGAAPALGGESTTRPAEAAAAAPAAAAPDPVAGTTAATPSGATATRAPGCPPIAAPMSAEGRKIFTGSGNCYACHGDNAKGTPMAPSLGAHAWLNIDGSYASIVELVTSGVPKPKAHPAPMPPKGGAQLSGQQVCAVAAYVYLLSH